eukprot:TRINITY_DN2068_c0_g2_i2.p1 TRINITY_DN2068_c0_g2~~TRINITY_DN2068_c0_g2_i2.p1  ORF type:complete len:638 (+),score=157.11 TRINITY_DN2068_c0_g2_i2:743-2656(+)
MHTMHGDISNHDDLWSAAAPVFKLDWTVETHMFIPEGPTLDNEGNLYFSPFFPSESISLVSLDAKTGKRRWTIEDPKGKSGGGAPLVLNDPDRPGRQIIYHATYETAWAIYPNGTILWKRSTGLVYPIRERDLTHVWGINYHPKTDSLLGVTADAKVFVLDRKSGLSRLSSPFQLPGSPSRNPNTVKPSPWLVHRGNQETDKVFGKINSGKQSILETIINAIFGDSTMVANFYCVDPSTGRIYIAATAPDEEDGVKDGFSLDGALYMLELVDSSQVVREDNLLELKLMKSYTFSGGTGSTPTMAPDSSRMLVSDDNNNIIALDKDLNFLWKVDVGHQVAASVACSHDNREIYAVTAKDVFRIQDEGDHAYIKWKANLNAYPDVENVNALTPTITANGIVVSIGAQKPLPGRVAQNGVMFRVGMALLDRETGGIRYFSEGREESISISVIGPDGSYYQALSPTRRAIARGVFGSILGDFVIPPLSGGISKYKPFRNDLLIRDITCACYFRVKNMLDYVTLARDEEKTGKTIHESPEFFDPGLRYATKAAERDSLQIEVLLRQANRCHVELQSEILENLGNLENFVVPEKLGEDLQKVENSFSDFVNSSFGIGRTENLHVGKLKKVEKDLEILCSLWKE